MSVCSLIIPCHPRNCAGLTRLQASIETARQRLEAQSWQVEVLTVHDQDSRGPSWARNRGLDRATGDFVFFADADDMLEPDFFLLPLTALEKEQTEMCFFSYNGGPVLRRECVRGNSAVRERFLPAFFGYSWADIHRWNAGGDIYARKEPGQVWRCAYRRSFIEKHKLRFNESMTFYEDAAFLSHCCAFAEAVSVIPDRLYRYEPRGDGNLATGYGSARHVDYKFRVLEFRQRLNRLTQNQIWNYCEASGPLTALELLRHRHFDALRRYCAEPAVARAIAEFPRSLRHPLAAAAITILRHCRFKVENSSE